MSDSDQSGDSKKTLSLGGKGTLSLSGAAATRAKQALTPGRGGIAVEVRRTRRPGSDEAPTQGSIRNTSGGERSELQNLTHEERDARIKALQRALDEQGARPASPVNLPPVGFSAPRPVEEKEVAPAAPVKDARQLELEELQRIEEEERKKAEEKRRQAEALAPRPRPNADGDRGTSQAAGADDRRNAPPGSLSTIPGRGRTDDDAGGATSYRDRMRRTSLRTRGAEDDNRAPSKLTVTQVLNEDYERAERSKSLAAVKRARAKARAMAGNFEAPAKVSREVILPETITVQELSNRMAERGADVIKALMRMGVIAGINQTIDADTAEVIINDMGHKVKRVTEAEVEVGIEGIADDSGDLVYRAPVVTIMGHVDHGKTSLLDSFRKTDVVAGEAGGITQHIGAYQITRPNGQKITFLDTPGHAAFSEMRARGANVTDIVVLVVAANDSIMPQTIEAINHAKAAGVPIIVAINKIDLPEANPNKVKQDLLQHEIVVEDMGGETLTVEVSAKKKINLDKLEEAILLQAEILDLKANPNRSATGTVVEAKLEQGRGSVATVLVENGTLRQGDIFVVGSEWGRVRALINDHGKNITEAGPGVPVEVLGLSGTPQAGDRLVVVENEGKARDIVDYRTRKKRDSASASSSMSFDQLLQKANSGKKQLPVVIKADVHGSVEAIASSLAKIAEDNEEVEVRVLHSGVGGITESDITLARASNAFVVGFNVRANAQARDNAKRDGVEIRYYNIIYNILDDVKAMLSGMLSPILREEYLGQASIRQVFNITRVGKVAGCMVTTGMVKRGAKVRLLRDDVVIHEGSLKTLKRFKDEVKEVREGMECGMAFENYDDIRDGDVIECYEVVSQTRSL